MSFCPSPFTFPFLSLSRELLPSSDTISSEPSSGSEHQSLRTHRNSFGFEHHSALIATLPCSFSYFEVWIIFFDSPALLPYQQHTSQPHISLCCTCPCPSPLLSTDRCLPWVPIHPIVLIHFCTSVHWLFSTWSASFCYSDLHLPFWELSFRFPTTRIDPCAFPISVRRNCSLH